MKVADEPADKPVNSLYNTRHRKISSITTKKEYLFALKVVRTLCYLAHERDEFEEQYYTELTHLILNYARIH